MKRILASIGLALLVLATGFYLYTGYLIHQHRKAVLAELKDPDSAKFQGEKLKEGWTLKTSVLCGQVNAKNEMGGYAGYRNFIASGDTMKLDIDREQSKDSWIADYCGITN